MGDQQGTLQVTDFELGWMAGVIDGEGTIAFSIFLRRERGIPLQEPRVKPQVIVTNTDKDLVEKVTEICGRCNVGAYFQTRKQHGHSFGGNNPAQYRPLYAVYIVGFKRVSNLLEIVGPHLVSKKPKAELVLRYIAQRDRKLSANTRAPLDAEDLRLMRDILIYSAANNVKGPKSTHLALIEGLLNEHEQRAKETLFG